MLLIGDNGSHHRLEIRKRSRSFDLRIPKHTFIDRLIVFRSRIGDCHLMLTALDSNRGRLENLIYCSLTGIGQDLSTVRRVALEPDEAAILRIEEELRLCFIQLKLDKGGRLSFGFGGA